MKKLLFALLLIYSSFLSASYVELSDGTTLECQINSGGVRICSSEDNVAIVTVDPHSGTIGAFGGDISGKGIKYFSVKRVVSEYDDVIYNSNEDNFVALTQDDIGLSEAFSYLQNLKGFLDQMGGGDEDEAYQSLKGKITALYYNNYDDIISRFNKDEFFVGDNSCKRFQDSKKDTAFRREYERSLRVSARCPYFKCSDGRLLTMKNLPTDMGDVFLDISKDGDWTIKPNDKKVRSTEGYLLANRIQYQEGEALFYSNEYMEDITDVGPQNYLPEKLLTSNSLAYNQALNGGWFHHLENSFELCEENPELRKIKDSYNSYRSKLLEQDLIHYITSINNSITGNYLDVNKLPEYACREGNTYFNPEVFEKAEELNPKAQNNEMAFEDAEKLFKMAQGMDDIAWKFKLDGCYARAHLMARRFEELGYKVDKAWIKGNLKVTEDNGNEINWNFHVAPVVYIKGADGKNAPYVIDPSIMDRPVPLSEWSGKMTKHLKEPGSQITRYPFPRNAALFGQAAVSLSNSSPYLPEEPNEMNEEDKMRMANNTMAMYKGLQ